MESVIEGFETRTEAMIEEVPKVSGRMLGVLASGRGSDFQAIIDAIERNDLRAEIAVLIVNKPDIEAIRRAERHGIPHVLIDHREHDREGFADRIDSVLREHNVDLVVLAGFMRVLPASLVMRWHLRILNIHPALLPSFPGAHAHRDALEHGVKVTGITVHFVDEHVDHGPIIFQYPVEVMDDDDEGSLSSRVLMQEHLWYPKVIGWVLDGRVHLEGRRVRVSK